MTIITLETLRLIWEGRRNHIGGMWDSPNPTECAAGLINGSNPLSVGAAVEMCRRYKIGPDYQGYWGQTEFVLSQLLVDRD